jgi:hypothetical protein
VTGAGFTDVWNERKRASSRFLNLEEVCAIAPLLGRTDQQLDESEDDSKLILEVVCQFRTAHDRCPNTVDASSYSGRVVLIRRTTMPLYLLIGPPASVRQLAPFGPKSTPHMQTGQISGAKQRHSAGRL